MRLQPRLVEHQLQNRDQPADSRRYSCQAAPSCYSSRTKGTIVARSLEVFSGSKEGEGIVSRGCIGSDSDAAFRHVHYCMVSNFEQMVAVASLSLEFQGAPVWNAAFDAVTGSP